MRNHGKDENVIALAAVLTLETAMEWIDDDELVEVTPKSMRVRKNHQDPPLGLRQQRRGRGALPARG
jgi:GTP-binding protein